MWTLFCLLIFCVSCTASSGDRSLEFQRCLSGCRVAECHPGEFPLALRLTLWTCSDNCAYLCTHAVTDEAEERIRLNGSSAARIQQFYGKWAFWRFLGMQEPASVIFSLLNLWAHVNGYRLLRHKMPSKHPMRKLYLWWSCINANVWIWSSVFHIRDKPTSEKLDYFSAGLAILFSLFVALVRVLHLYRPPIRKHAHGFPPRAPPYRGLAIIFSVLYICHVSYLSLAPRFDYGYNIVVNVVVGMVHNFLWVLFSVPFTPFQRYPSRPNSRGFKPYPHSLYGTQKSGKWRGTPAIIALLTTLATSLELFDFPPWRRVIDAHSLWHLATAPIAVLWYRFLVQDSLDDGWAESNIEFTSN
ncbi:Per1-like protein [Cantharellus anzutake]|uniref:Per1-like protein n=1 Tax=Cantharellus anzutake TaxID=1750568 RepID=UPI0019058A24|nr:Per1-like protein [Cantharellus anzutake]KAF8328836.1 Per1-like protein [Cantharellus anzutake]